MSAERMVSSGVGPREERSARSMLVFSSFLAMGSGSCTAVPLFTEMPRGVISIVRCGLVRDVQLYERAFVVSVGSGAVVAACLRPLQPAQA